MGTLQAIVKCGRECSAQCCAHFKRFPCERTSVPVMIEVVAPNQFPFLLNVCSRDVCDPKAG